MTSPMRGSKPVYDSGCSWCTLCLCQFRGRRVEAFAATRTAGGRRGGVRGEATGAFQTFHTLRRGRGRRAPDPRETERLHDVFFAVLCPRVSTRRNRERRSILVPQRRFGTHLELSNCCVLLSGLLCCSLCCRKVKDSCSFHKYCLQSRRGDRCLGGRPHEGQAVAHPLYFWIGRNSLNSGGNSSSEYRRSLKYRRRMRQFACTWTRSVSM